MLDLDPDPHKINADPQPCISRIYDLDKGGHEAHLDAVLLDEGVLRWNSWTSILEKTRVFCSMLFTVFLLTEF